MQYWSFSVWLISLSIMPLRSIRVAANPCFLWLKYMYMCMCVCVCVYKHTHTYHNFFIYSSVNGHLQITLQWTWGFRYLFDIVSSFTSDIFLEVELLDHVVVIFLTFWRASILLVAAPIYNLSNGAQGLPFLLILAHIGSLGFLMMAVLTGLRWYLIVVLPSSHFIHIKL